MPRIELTSSRNADEHAGAACRRREVRCADARDGGHLFEQLVDGDVVATEEISLTRTAPFGGEHDTGCEVADIEASEPDRQGEPQLFVMTDCTNLFAGAPTGSSGPNVNAGHTS